MGKNFTFDQRLGERITEHVLTTCATCDQPCDIYANCTNMACQVLFHQCETCRHTRKGACSYNCQTIVEDPETHAHLKKQGCRLNHHERVQSQPSSST
jgi:UPF0176 protein